MYKILFLLSLCLLVGCRPKPIDIDIQTGETKIVVASQIIPNKVMLVNLTKSFSALQGKDAKIEDSVNTEFLNQLLINDAIVVVTYLNRKDTLFKINPGVYGSINILQYTYGNYYLEVKDRETNQSITATTQLIPKVVFDTVYPVVVKTAKDTVIKINFTLKDDPQTTNYYVINYVFKKKTTVKNPLTSIDINQVYARGKNTVSKQFELLDDNSFTNYELTLSKEIKDAKANDSIAVVLSHISKGYFEYLNAFKRSGALINQITSEPISYPTNVNNGYGYFNAYYPSVYYFNLKDY